MKNKIYLLFFLFFITASVQSFGQSRVITGKVVAEGRGLSDVVVTDGSHFAQTSKDGSYKIVINSNSHFVYLSTPSGYLPKHNGSRPLFYHQIDKSRDNHYDFYLEKNSKNDYKHTFVVHADPQLFKEGNLKPYETILDDCKRLSTQYDTDFFGIDCGDLVGDKPELYPSYIKLLDKMNIPFYRVIGNHDMTLYGRSHETSYSKFESLFGPSYYSFNRGKAHYIILNDVFYLARDYFYAGYITENQLAWLEQDLSYVEEGTLVFVAMHIPSRLEVGKVPFEYSNANVAGRVSNAAFLYELLQPYQSHILSGHTHYNRNLIHSDRLFEHITAAVCGTWWQGGVCLDGTPQGYGVYEVDGDKVKWFFKSAGHSKDYQFRSYPIGTSKDYPNDVLVNVWNYDDSWKVEWLEDGHVMGELERIECYDPAAQQLCADKDKLEFKWISALKNKHMFKASVLNKCAKIEIRVTDRFGNVYQKVVEDKL